MINLEQLCRGIHMPDEVTDKVLSLRKDFDFTKLNKHTEQLLKADEWEEGLTELKKSLPEDKEGFLMLTCMLITGLTIHENFLKKGISDEIFYDTFGCFSRFVKEHLVTYGTYGFDREFWTPRQLSMLLFRIGELEYELYSEKGRQLISIHIPSDAKLTMENCRVSYDMAKEFFLKNYPDFHYENFICESWLLSPYLKDILPEDSHIVKFQNAFVIESVDTESKDYMEWVFKNRKITIDEVPQTTSLQRRMKEYIKNGGVIGNGAGYLKPDAFK